MVEVSNKQDADAVWILRAAIVEPCLATDAGCTPSHSHSHVFYRRPGSMTDCVSAKACLCTAAGDRRKKYADLCGTAFAVDQFLTAAEGGFGVAGVDTRPDADHTPSLRDASGSHAGCAPLAAPQMILLSDRSARALVEYFGVC